MEMAGWFFLCWLVLALLAGLIIGRLIGLSEPEEQEREWQEREVLQNSWRTP